MTGQMAKKKQVSVLLNQAALLWEGSPRRPGRPSITSTQENLSACPAVLSRFCSRAPAMNTIQKRRRRRRTYRKRQGKKRQRNAARVGQSSSTIITAAVASPGQSAVSGRQSPDCRRRHTATSSTGSALSPVRPQHCFPPPTPHGSGLLSPPPAIHCGRRPTTD